VLSLDWGKKTQRLLSAGADRNAFVWTFVDDEWRPMLVVLRLGRAATCVKVVVVVVFASRSMSRSGEDRGTNI
jgi:hypothetical protein